MRQTQPKRRQRQHTPVWNVVWSVRPRFKELLETLETAAARDSVSYWAKIVGKECVLIPLKLLHLLLQGYEPQLKKPAIRYVSPTPGRR